MVDTVREGTSTTATLSVGGTVNGTIDQNGMNGVDLTVDKDWYRVELVAGRTYTFSGTAGVSNSDTLDAIAIRLYNSSGNPVSSTADTASPSFTFTATTGGTYYLAVSAGGSGAWQDKTGAFRVSLADTTPVGTTDTVREGTSTTATLSVGGTVNGTIDQNGMNGVDLTVDKDWYRVELVAGRTYSFSGTAGVSNSDTLDAIAIRLYNSSGNPVSSTADTASPSFTFTATTGGTYYLAVSAGGSGAWQDKTGAFRVSLADTTPVGTTDTVREGTSTTATLSVGGTVNGTIDQNGMNGVDLTVDKDWYRVELVAGRTYSFSGTAGVSNSDTLDAIAIRLYNSSGNPVSSTADTASPSFTFTATTGGTYYLAVSAGGSGAWQDKTGAFRVSLADTTPVGTTDTVREGTSTTATLSVGGTVNGTIDQNGMNGVDLTVDKDWYRVELVAGRTYTFSGTAGVSNSDTLDAIAIRLYNSSGNPVSSTADTASPSFTFTATTGGTYYLAVSAGGSGAWQDKTGAFRVSLADTTPVGTTDTVREGTSTTATLSVGGTVNGTIDQNGMNGVDLTVDKDWYRVELVAGRTYTFSGTAGVSNSDTLDAIAIRLYNSSGNPVSSTADTASPSFTFTATTGGTYYLAVSAGGSGAWQDKTGAFRVSLADTTPVGTTDTVREGTSTTATLSVGGTVNGTIDQNGMNGVDLTVDKDWYRVELVAGRTYTFSGTAGVSNSDTLDAIAIRLYNSSGNPVSSTADTASPSFTFTATTGGTYYLAVSAGGSGAWQDKTGAFRVSLADTTPVGTTDTVREGTSTTATLSVGGTVNGTIDQNGMNGVDLTVDKDWYRVELVAGRTYTFSGTAGVSNSDTLDRLAIRLYDRDGNAAWSTADAASPSFTFSATIGGTYYLAVSAGGSSTPVAWQDKTGAFQVSVVEHASDTLYSQIFSELETIPVLNWERLADFAERYGFLQIEYYGSSAVYENAVKNISEPLILFREGIGGRIGSITVNVADIPDALARASFQKMFFSKLGILGFVPDIAEVGTALLKVGQSPDGADRFFDVLAGVGAGIAVGAAIMALVPAGAGALTVVSVGLVGAVLATAAKDYIEQSERASSFFDWMSDMLNVGPNHIGWDDPLYAAFRMAGSTPSMIIEAKPEVEAHSVSSAAPVVVGGATNLSGDSILGFQTTHQISISNLLATRPELSITSKSALISLPSSVPGGFLDPITLPGDFSNGEFMAIASNGATNIRFVEFLPTLRDGAPVLNPNVHGIQNPDFFRGNGERDLAVRVIALPNAAGDPTDAFGVFWIDALGNISNVRFINPGLGAIIDAPLVLDTLPQGMTLGLFLADGGADLARTLTSADTIRLIPHPDGVSDGLWLEVNGVLQNLNIFNSVSRTLNPDGLNHVVSGPINGGTGMIIGFEDSLGYRSGDFADLVIEVTEVGSRPRYDLQISGGGTSIESYERGESGRSLVTPYNGGPEEFKGSIRFVAFLSADQSYSSDDIIIADFILENEFARSHEIATTALYGYTIPDGVALGDYYFGKLILGPDGNADNNLNWLENNRDDNRFTVTEAAGLWQENEISISDSDVNWTLVAAPGGSTLRGNEQDNRIQGGSGSDVAYGGEGSDWIFGAAGNDTLSGGNGDDTLSGDIGNDFIVGGVGNDLLFGGDGDDHLISGIGADYVSGDAGRDTIELIGNAYHTAQFVAYNVSSATQTGTGQRINLNGKVKLEAVIDGGSDINTIYLGDEGDAFFLHDAYSGFHQSLTLTPDYIGNDSMQRFINIQRIFGMDGDDIIDLTSPDYSLAGASIMIDGGEGNDVIWGSDANETIYGGSGDDTIFGGTGTDFLFGGAGADVFEFTKTSTNTTVADFNPGEGDLLRFYNRGGAQFDPASIGLTDYGIRIAFSEAGNRWEIEIALSTSADQFTFSLADIIGSTEFI